MTSRALIFLGDDRIAQLDRIAKSRGLSRAAVIREAVDRVIGDSAPDAVEQAQRNAAIDAAFGLWKHRTDICRRAAALRRDRPRLKLPDAVILASAQANGRILVTRNTKDFPANMPGIRVPYTL